MKISEAIASINQRTLRPLLQNMVKRVNACIQENGGHFQHLSWTVLQVLLYCSITKWNVGCVSKWTPCRSRMRWAYCAYSLRLYLFDKYCTVVMYTNSLCRSGRLVYERVYRSCSCLPHSQRTSRGWRGLHNDAFYYLYNSSHLLGWSDQRIWHRRDM
jgi:hypothetical protein